MNKLDRACLKISSFLPSAPRFFCNPTTGKGSREIRTIPKTMASRLAAEQGFLRSVSFGGRAPPVPRAASAAGGRNLQRRPHPVLRWRGVSSSGCPSMGSSHRAADVSVEGGMELNVPILSCSEVMERLNENQGMRSGNQQYLAMYSSIAGGVTTDPAAMVIPMDDHMVHRGHGVFDTATIVDGCLYELEQHLDRFLRSASMARIDLPFDRSRMRNILVQTVSASKCRNGSLRYWLSAGPGDFLLSSSGCHNSAFYAIVINDQSPSGQKGVKVITSSIPIKSPQFAVMKSVNYLPNVLSKMEAEEHGAYAAIWVDSEGYIAEGPNMNVAFVTEQRELVMPHFDKILSGCTARRILVLAERLVLNGTLSRVGVCNMTVEEGKMAREMMLIGSGVLVKPILQWDESIIGDGKEGPVTQSLLDLLLEDMRSGPADVRTPVFY